jgi:HD-GYP domain-containing protein (c-di-GMP phosphodiesterase class II)
METTALTRPQIEDLEALDDFFDAINEYAPRIERDVANLLKQPGDRNLTASLFRSMHTIKGDASLCKLPGIVAIAHPVENLLARHREGEIDFSHTLAELVLLTLDRIELAVEAMRQGRTLEPLHLVPLVEGLQRLSTVPADRLEKDTAEVIRLVTGLTPSGRATGQISEHPAAAGRADWDSDLALFKRLALQLEARSPLYRGRTLRNLRLALQANKEAGSPVDPVQLEAAVYLHDMGMMFLKESTWLKAEILTADDRQVLRTHPDLAADLLERMPGWGEAALMVRQHHETPSGGGYPLGIKEAEICPGAKLLAAVDAFESVMLKHLHRGRSRSLLRAIAEINACNDQFSQEWIGPLNAVVRRIIEA